MSIILKVSILLDFEAEADLIWCCKEQSLENENHIWTSKSFLCRLKEKARGKSK